MKLKPHPVFTKYLIGDDGSVWGNTGPNGYARFIPFKMKTRLAGQSGRQYLGTGLRLNGKTVNKYVHTLVLEAFIGPRPSKKHEGAHGDGNRLNNTLENLRWATKRQNISDKIKHGRSNAGEKNWRSKLKEKDVLDIRKRRKMGVYLKTLAAEYGIGLTYVCDVALGHTWKHLPV